ncbi:translin-associated factor X-interacting protein 1 [Neodiprion lecontei]|uniref:Translin-associated factor X-interacting protein 1 n=1 Tax=Neodiprion lecontei TaxID=441921 RepID=A0A6J0B8Z7_NEOLC|nr:translin-associated factor X-interacting protein 1 [Neodiprion lecontei]
MFPNLFHVKSVHRQVRLNEVLARLEGAKIQHKILKPPKSSMIPGCRHCRIRMKNSCGRKVLANVSSRDKPVFIAKLEHFVEKEVNRIASEKRSECREVSCDHLLCDQKKLDAELAIYKSAFEVLLTKIRTFKPLLSRIKSTYDKCIEVRDDRMKLMEIVSSKLETFKKTVEKKIDTIERTGTGKVGALMREKSCLTETVAKLRADLEESNGKINCLRHELLDCEEREIRRIVNQRRQNIEPSSGGAKETKMVRRQTAQSRRLLEDPVLMNICLERARKDLSTAHRKIAELEDTFREVVPKWELERLENRHQAFEREYRNLSQEFEALSKEHEALKVNFEVVREQKNSLRDRCKILAHTNTPRPDWSKCGQFIQGGVQRWRDITAKKSSEDRLTILLSELCGVASAENDYFVGQGTDPSVPVFLRYKGKMKNRKLGRREVSILINDIWKSRMASDMGTPMGEYVLKYFSERYHISLLRYEWIYNLYYACQRLVYDDQIGLFWNILWGNVVEEAYHAPRKEFVLLKRMMEMRMEDKKINALLAQDLMDVMDVMYPQKSNRDIENIVYAAGKQLGIDPSTEAFDVAKLFAQTEEGWERGDFARELARQTKQEITEFGKGILHSINIHDKTSEVTVEMLKKGFMEVDEDIHQNLLTQHLKWIYKVQDLSKAKPMVSSAIVRQMLNGYIRRSQLKNHRRN